MLIYNFGTLVSATVASLIIFCVSAILSIILSLLLFLFSIGSQKKLSKLSIILINIFRGIPTSLWVVFAGLTAIKFFEPAHLPLIYINTHSHFQLIAWFLVLALSVSSSGHFAEFLRSAYATLERDFQDQIQVLGFKKSQTLTIIVFELTPLVIVPFTTRLVHHLHNTAFVSLFPIFNLFSLALSVTETTFDLWFTVFSGFIYLGLSIVISLSGEIMINRLILK